MNLLSLWLQLPNQENSPFKSRTPRCPAPSTFPRDYITPFPKCVCGTFPIRYKQHSLLPATNFFIKKPPVPNIFTAQCLLGESGYFLGKQELHSDNFQTPNVFRTRAKAIFCREGNNPANFAVAESKVLNKLTY